MAVYSKQLHFLRNGEIRDVKLYASLSDVVDADVLNADGTTGGIKLYTSPSDVYYPYLRLMDGDTPVYAQLEEMTADNANETGLKVSGNGRAYVVLKQGMPPAGTSLGRFRPKQIKEIVNRGLASTYFHVGDTIGITLNGNVGKVTYDNETYYATILGFDHNKAIETNNKSSIHFVIGKDENGTDIALCDFTGAFSDDTANTAFYMDLQNTVDGCNWDSCHLRNTICPQFFAAMPQTWQNVIAEISKKGVKYNSAHKIITYETRDKIWIMSSYEVTRTSYPDNQPSDANYQDANYQQQYAYYQNGNSVIRYNNISGASVRWRTRAIGGLGGSYGYYAGAIEPIRSSSGYADEERYYRSCGFCPCFAIVAD